MTEEEKARKIKQIQKDSEQLQRIRRDLLLIGFAPDGPEVRMMEDLLWKLTFRIFT